MLQSPSYLSKSFVFNNHQQQRRTIKKSLSHSVLPNVEIKAPMELTAKLDNRRHSAGFLSKYLPFFQFKHQYMLFISSQHNLENSFGLVTNFSVTHKCLKPAGISSSFS